MNDYSTYLLRTDGQRREFLRHFGRYMAKEAGSYISWIESFPLMKWTRYLAGVPEKNIPVLIGVLCILYCERKINISFDNTAQMIRREPKDLDEWENYE